MAYSNKAPEAFEIGIICALPIELAAMQEVLDEEYEDPAEEFPNDTNTYSFGCIGKHNVVIACLPAGMTGTNSANLVASNLMRTFTLVKILLLVGIGGGVPSSYCDIRLGDVVVSQPSGDRGGVVYYNFGKAREGGVFEQTGIQRPPPQEILTALGGLQAKHIRGKIGCLPKSVSKFQQSVTFKYPGLEKDCLFETGSIHIDDEDCKGCDKTKIIQRRPRADPIIPGVPVPVIHYGLIASSDQLMKDSRLRDALSACYGGLIRCFEMEAAGLMNGYPCLVIRGISDYSDSHKRADHAWHGCAAAMAASYAKALINELPAKALVNVQPLEKAKDEKLLEEFVESLKFPNMDLPWRELTCAEPGTCQWLFKMPYYEAWMSGKSSMLWIKGKPGSGKSTLMKRVFEEQKLQSIMTETRVAAFYFSSNLGRDAQESMSMRHMLQSLIYQLAKDDHSIMQPFLREFEDKKGQAGKTVCWTLKELQDFLLEALRRPGTRTIVIVDAVDESGDQSTKDIIYFFDSVVKNSDTFVSICLSTCRDVKITVDGCYIVYVDENNKEDIRTYVHKRLSLFKGLYTREPLNTTILARNVMKRAKRSFFWVRLVVEKLENDFIRGRKYEKMLLTIGKMPPPELLGPVVPRRALAEEEKECFKSLLFKAYSARLGKVGKANRGTCGWILKHPKFKHWVRSPESDLVILSGKPGCGKSVLGKYIVNKLRFSESQAAHPLVLHFFFDGRGDEIEKSMVGMFRALLYQICLDNPSFIGALGIIEAYRTLTAQQRSSDAEWPLAILQSLCSKIRGQDCASVVYIIIDALDECEPVSAFEVLRFLRDLTTPSRGCKVKIFITSRPTCLYEYLDKTFDRYPRIDLDSTDSEYALRDVEKFVKDEFSKLPRDNLESLRHLVVERAQGIFLWAKIVMKKVAWRSKKGDKSKELIAMVNDLPSEMDALYKEILSQTTDEKDIEHRRIMLLWILFAQRPLTISEFRVAIELVGYNSESQIQLASSSTALERRPTSEEQLLEDSINEHQLGKRLVILSGGLLELKHSSYVAANVVRYDDFRDISDNVGDSDGADDRDEPTSSAPIVQLIHQSAKEYLLGHWNDWHPSSDAESADDTGHLHLALGCLQYLGFEKLCDWRLREKVRDREKLALKTSYKIPRGRFFEYCALYWPGHTRCAAWRPALWEQFSFFSSHLEKFLWAVEVFEKKSETVCPTSPLHFACAQGLDLLVSELLLHGAVDVDTKDEKCGRTPLSWAAKCGQEAVVRQLLHRVDIDVNSKDNDNKTPLSWAAEMGHAHVVLLLLQCKHVDADCRGDGRQTPLMLAAKRGDEQVLKLLLERRDVDVNSRDTDGSTPLGLAASLGHKQIVKLLLKHPSIDLNSRDHAGRTPLYYAGAGGPAVLQLMLEHPNVDANSKDLGGQTVLSYAAASGSVSVMKLLLECPSVDRNSRDREGRTPLALASNSWEAVKLLLACDDIDINSKDNNGRTPLSMAAERGQELSVKLLLDCQQIEADSKDNTGRTALSWAVAPSQFAATPATSAQYDIVVGLLLAHPDVDINAQDNSGHTPQWWAKRKGRDALLSLLYDFGPVTLTAHGKALLGVES